MKKMLPERFGIIQKVILVIAVFAMSVVWPLGAFPVSHVSTSEWDGMRFSGPSNESGYVRQEFSPNFESLESISVYVVNDPDSIDTMKAVLRVYDYTGACLSENYFQVEDYELPGYINIPVELELTPGTLYFYTIGGVDGDLFVAYCNDEAKTAENGAFFYKEVPSGGTSIVTQYEYERPMGLKRIFVFDFTIAIGATLFIGLIGVAKAKVFKKCGEEKAIALWKRAENIVRSAIVVVAIIGVIVGFLGIVINKLFTDDIVNIIVLFLGVVIAGGYICYGVLTCKSELEPLAEGEADLCEKGVHFVRTLLFAATILMCCMYLNGYSNYEKGLYLRKLLVAFGLFMISTGKCKWIWNIPNAIWSVAAFMIGRIHISNHSAHIEHINTATNDAWVIWVIGLITIQIIYRVVKGEWSKLKQISIPYFILTLLFWIGCIIFANGRQWPALLCVVMLVWIFFYTTSDNKEQTLENICNGILMAFAGCVIFCLYRRPYQYFMLARYGGIFFTATTTATYYLVPAAASLTKLLVAIKGNNKEKKIFSSCMFGIVTAYMAFTASRTGILSLIVMVLFAFAVPMLRTNKEVCKKQLKEFVLLSVSVLMTFVMTFSATRMLPAISGNPFYFWFEKPNAYLTSETPWKGVKYTPEQYADIQLTLEMLFGRLFALEEEEVASNDAKGYALGPMLVSAESTAVVISEQPVMNYANGRMEIFQAYMSQLNLYGHDTMSAIDANGEALMHAHNSYIQVAFDFGIPVGIVFLIFCLITFLKALCKANNRCKTTCYNYIMLLVVIGFGVASVVEWVYHMANPLGFTFLAMVAPLMLKNNRECEV